MFYDLADPNSFVADVKAILAPDGIWCIQLSYLPLMLTNMNFYDICHEHLSYYSLDALQEADGAQRSRGVRRLDQCGQWRQPAGVRDACRQSARLHRGGRSRISRRWRSTETALELEQAQTYRDYFDKIEDLAHRVNAYLDADIRSGGKVFGLGASTKGNVLLQFFGITKEKMPYISERNPDKVGLRTLGTDFELISEEQARDLRPTQHAGAALVLQERDRRARGATISEQGGKLLFPMPYAHVVTKDGEIAL